MISMLSLIYIACPSCFGEGAVRVAYYVSAAFMMAMPLFLIGGSIKLMRRPHVPTVLGFPGPGTIREANRRVARKAPLLLTLVGCASAFGLAVALESRSPETQQESWVLPATSGPVEMPPFSLLDQSGSSYGTEQLAGRVWVANFMFTRCTTVCPILTGHMADVQERTRHLPESRLVSISVDPQGDTPNILEQYAQKHGADAGRWHFLTGDYATIETAIESGLEGTEFVDMHSVLHGGYAVLLGGDARVRGYYEITNEEGFEALVRDLELLAKGSFEQAGAQATKPSVAPTSNNR